MPVYLVTYDLIAKPGETRDYQPVYDALNEFENFEVLYSVCLVKAESVAAVETAVAAALRKTDRYFVTRLRRDEYKYRAINGVNGWLAAHSPG